MRIVEGSVREVRKLAMDLFAGDVVNIAGTHRTVKKVNIISKDGEEYCFVHFKDGSMLSNVRPGIKVTVVGG